MADSVDRLLIRIDATTESLRRELRKADGAVVRHQKRVESSLKRIDKSFERVRKSVRGLQGAIVALGFAKAVKEVISAADSFTKMQGQIKLVTESQEELNYVYQNSLRISNQLGQATETTVNLYERLARSTAQLNLSNDELLNITETISKAMLVSNASAEEASRAIVQLSQALQGGVLRAEEFNSITEQAPYLLDQMAESLKVTRGQLREMVVSGEVTTEMMVASFRDMRDRVAADAEQIPMTIGRSMQSLANTVNDSLGQIDTTELQSSIAELGETLSDPRMQQALKDIATALITITEWAAKAAQAYAEFGRTVGEFIAKLQGYKTVQDEITEKEERLASIRGSSNRRVQKEAKRLEAQIAALKKRYGEFAEVQTEVVETTKEEANSTFKLVKVQAKRHTHSKDYQKFLKAEAKEKARRAKALAKYIDDLQHEVDIMKKSAKEQAVLNAVRDAGVAIDSEAGKKIRELTEARWEHNAAMERAEETAKRAEDALKNATQEVGPFTKALQDAAARIDEQFASAWQKIFTDFDSFADRMKDAFKQLMGELANVLISRKLVIPIATSLGFGTGSAAAAGGTGIAGLGGIPGMFAGNTFLNNASVGISNTGLGLAQAFGYTPTAGQATLIGGLATGGAGLAGGLLANQMFSGAYVGTGSALGGLAGGIGGASLGTSLGMLGGAAGPLGALAGALAGGAIGSLFGGNNKGKQSGKAILDLATGSISAFGVGNTFDPANVQAAEAAAQILSELAKQIGTSAGSLEVQVGNRGLLKLDGEKVGSQAEFFAKAVKILLDGSDDITDAVKSLIENFDGAAEELISFTGSIISINKLMADNPVATAVEDFAAAQEMASKTLTEVFGEQLDAINELTSSFDGSIESVTTLNNLMVSNSALAYDLAMALGAVGESIGQQARSQAAYFADAARSPAERLQFQQWQFEQLFKLLPTLTDPGQIQDVSNRLLGLNRSIFDAGPGDLQRLNVDTYINSALAIEQAAGTALEAAQALLQSDIDARNNAVQESVTAAAAAFDAPASKIENAANVIYEAAQIIAGGGNNEVVA